LAGKLQLSSQSLDVKKKPGEELSVPTRRQAMRVARMIGCSGAHQDDAGNWLPCPTPDALSEIIGSGKKELPKRKRRGRGGVRPSGYERLIERGVMGIDTLPGGGLVSAPVGTKAARRARSDRLAATPASRRDRISGSKRNRIGSASSSSSGRSIQIDEATLTSLKSKVKEHNQSVANGEPWKKARLGALKSVYRRGAGAFSMSHRPGMTRNQWAMGRVNAFLKILKSGRPENDRYTTDNDLLHRDHPWRTRRIGKSLDAEEMKGSRRDRFARDGDLDGQVQDGTPYQRPSRTLSHRAIGRRRAAELRRRYLRLRDLPEPTALPNSVTEETVPVKRNIA
jgi:hypothetical protein